MRLLLSHRADPTIRLPDAEKGEPATPWEFAEASDLQDAEQCAKLVELKMRENAGKEGLVEQKQDPAALAKLRDVLGEKKFDLRMAAMAHLAIRYGNIAHVSKWLRDGGRDTLNTTPLDDGVWALTAAAGYGQPEIVRRLLKAKASADPPADPSGHFPLLLACSIGNEGQPSHLPSRGILSNPNGLIILLSSPRSRGRMCLGAPRCRR